MQAVDPEPGWFSTQASAPMIVAEANGNYSIDLTKLDVNGSALGSVDKSKLRIVLCIQRDKTTIDSVPEEHLHDYVNWDANQAGRLNVHVPANLPRGRLLIGVRPNLGDAAQNAIAERWSALILVDVWPQKPNVTSIDLKKVYYPTDDHKGMRAGSAFDLQSITIAAEQAMTEPGFKDRGFKPLVVKDLNLQVGQLIDYRIPDATGGKYPYGGRILKVINGNDGQQLVFLGFDFIDVYDTTFANIQANLVEYGVMPEFISYRSEGLSSVVEKSVTYLGAKNRATIQAAGQSSWFDTNCKDKATSKIIFSPYFDLEKVEAGIDYELNLKGAEISCKIFSKTEGYVSFPLPGFLAALKYLVGAGIDVGPFGEINVKGKFESDLTSLTLSGKISSGVSTPMSLKFGSGSLGGGLDAPAETVEVQAEGKLGLFMKGNAVKLTIPKFGDVDFSLTGKIASVLAVNALGLNPAAAKSGGSSKIATSLTPEASLEASETINNYLQSMGLKKFKLSEKLNGGFSFPVTKASYIIDSVFDSGEGYATVSLLPENKFLSDIFGNGSIVDGYLSLKDSSVYNDKNNSIHYEMNECKDKAGTITSPIVGCIGGFFCGNVNDPVYLCKPTEPRKDCGATMVPYPFDGLPPSAYKKWDQTCVYPLTKPVERYVISQDQQWATDIVTGLTWSRCIVGEYYENGQCVGNTRRFTHTEAVDEFADKLPSIFQRMSLIDSHCAVMARNEFVFPKPKDSSLFEWTSDMGPAGWAWQHGNTAGTFGCMPRIVQYGVRLLK